MQRHVAPNLSFCFNSNNSKFLIKLLLILRTRQAVSLQIQSGNRHIFYIKLSSRPPYLQSKYIIHHLPQANIIPSLTVHHNSSGDTDDTHRTRQVTRMKMRKNGLSMRFLGEVTHVTRQFLKTIYII